MSGRSTLSKSKSSKISGPKWSKTRSNNGEDVERRVLTKYAKILFGEEVVNELKVRKLRVRDIWELTTPTIQCNNTIGIVTPETRCWICDELITEARGMTADCEHILPVAQAAIWLRLYSPGIETARDRGAAALEYGWAHAVCNQEKSDICALISKSSGFMVDVAQIRKLLKSIFNSSRVDSAALKTVLRRHGTYEQFIAARLPEIVGRYQRIVDFITRGENGLAAATVITMAGVSGLSDLNIIRKELHALLSPDRLRAAAEAEQAELERAAAIFSRGEAVENITQMLGFYDAVQESVVATLQNIIRNIPVQPAYREYFATRGINARAPLKSLNPSGFQNEIFRFLADVYPRLYRTLMDHRAVTSAAADFISLKMLPTFLPASNNASRRPDRFFREIREGMERLEGRLNTMVDSVSMLGYLNTEYDKFIQINAARTMLTLGHNTRRLNTLIEAAEI